MRRRADPDTSLVSMTPGVSSGYPCVRGTGVSADGVALMWLAGDSLAVLADDYGRPLQDIEDAVRFVVWHWRKRRPLPHAEAIRERKGT